MGDGRGTPLLHLEPARGPPPLSFPIGPCPAPHNHGFRRTQKPIIVETELQREDSHGICDRGGTDQ